MFAVSVTFTRNIVNVDVVNHCNAAVAIDKVPSDDNNLNLVSHLPFIAILEQTSTISAGGTTTVFGPG